MLGLNRIGNSKKKDNKIRKDHLKYRKSLLISTFFFDAYTQYTIELYAREKHSLIRKRLRKHFLLIILFKANIFFNFFKCFSYSIFNKIKKKIVLFIFYS